MRKMYKVQSKIIVLSTTEKVLSHNHDKTMREPVRRVLLIQGVFGLSLLTHLWKQILDATISWLQ